jgi:transglutaminase-like putative cysteine protease
MRSRRHIGLVAAAATLLASAPLSTIFDQWTWFIQSFIAVGLIAGAAALARTLRGPLWAQALAMAGTLLLALTWMFPSGREVLAIVPTPATFTHFGELLSGAVRDMRQLAVPVGDTDSLLFLTVLGIGAVAVAVDLCAAGLHRPALAGLPMLAIYSVPVAIYTDAVHPLPFIVGAAGFLWLLVADSVDRVRRFGHRYTGDGRDVDVWEPSPLAAAGRRLAVLGVVVAVLLPLTVPGMTGGLLDRLGQSSGVGEGRPGLGGGPGRINLFAALSGQLRQTEATELAKVTTPEKEPGYLRFGVADAIRIDGFGVRNPSGSSVTRGLPDPREGERPGVTQGKYRAEVDLTDAFNMPLLPIYPEPLSMGEVEGSWLYDDDMGIVFSSRSQSKGKKYSFEYVHTTYTPAALNAAKPLPSDNPFRRQFTSVPQRVEQVETLVENLTSPDQTDYAKVLKIYEYFSRDNGFSYSLTTEGGTSGTDIGNFLTKKVGFCQQYAAALAWVVRAAGVPARVAFGFTNGTTRQGDTITLTNLNLHAWTEVYFDGLGWVPFDATPAASVPGSVRTEYAPDSDAPPPIATAPGSPGATPSDDALNPADPSNRELEGSEAPGAAAGTNQPKGPTWPLWVVAAVAAVLALLATPALLRALLRRRRERLSPARGSAVTGEPEPGEIRVLPAGEPTERARAEAHAAWAELVDTMVDFRVPVDPTETPRTTVERLAAQRVVAGTGAEAARLLGRAEERARYARHPLGGQRLAPAVRAFRKALAAETTWRRRAVAALLPPSILQRWREALVEAATQTVMTAGRVRDVLLRWSPRRLLTARGR